MNGSGESRQELLVAIWLTVIQWPCWQTVFVISLAGLALRLLEKTLDVLQQKRAQQSVGARPGKDTSWTARLQRISLRPSR
jgi:hypothetical protein